MNEFAKRLRDVRLRRGLSIKEISALLKVSSSTYREWEYGRSIQKVEVCLALKDALGVSLHYLMAGRDDDLEEPLGILDRMEEHLGQLKKLLRKR